MVLCYYNKAINTIYIKKTNVILNVDYDSRVTI